MAAIDKGASDTVASDPDSVSSVDDPKPTLSESSSLINKEDEEKAKKRLLFGIGLAVLFTISTTLSIPCLQLLVPANIQPLELLFLAFTGHLLSSIPLWFVFWKRLQCVDHHEVFWLALTGVSSVLSTLCFYMASESLPAGVVGAVNQGSMLIFSVLIYAVLDRHVGKLIIAATVLCSVGLALYLASTVYYDPVTVDIPANLSQSEDPLVVDLQRDTYQTRVHFGLQRFHPSLPYVVLLISSLLLIIPNVIIHRKFGMVSIIKLLLFFPLTGFLVALIAMFAFSTPQWNLQFNTPEKVFPLLGFLILFIVANISLYASWMRTPAPIFSLITAGSIVLLVLIQYVVPVPGIEAGTLDPLEICGALLILLANIIGPLAELQMDPCKRCVKET